MCVSRIRFQFHNHGTKKNILSEKNGCKIHVFNQKSRVSGMFKKSVLDLLRIQNVDYENNSTVLCISERGQIVN